MWYRKCRRLEDSAHDDPAHGEPHGFSSTEIVANEEVENATAETAQIVDRHNNAGQAVVRIPEGGSEVLIADDA